MTPSTTANTRSARFSRKSLTRFIPSRFRRSTPPADRPFHAVQIHLKGHENNDPIPSDQFCYALCTEDKAAPAQEKPSWNCLEAGTRPLLGPNATTDIAIQLDRPVQTALLRVACRREDTLIIDFKLPASLASSPPKRSQSRVTHLALTLLSKGKASMFFLKDQHGRHVSHSGVAVGNGDSVVTGRRSSKITLV